MTQVRVSAEDIMSGITLDPKLCPVAYAINRAIPENTYVSVGPTIVSIRAHDGSWKNYALPFIVTAFIRDFDKGSRVKPFTFDLDTDKPLTLADIEYACE